MRGIQAKTLSSDETLKKRGISMDIFDDQEHFPDERPDGRRTREEIIRAVTEGEKIDVDRSKFLVIPESSVSDADIDETAESLNIQKNSKAFELLKLYCDVKNATAVQAKALMQRAEPLSEEQLNLLRLVCEKENFRARDILKLVGTVRRFGSDRLLILHAFAGLEGASPGALDRLGTVAMPQVSREAGQEAYEEELREKSMTRDQINVFYNICTRLEGITPGAALSLLPPIRSLKPQHAQMLNTFLTKEACFGEKPITTHSVPGLVKLWLSLPQMSDTRKFKKLVKKLSRQPDKKKRDFKFLVQVYKSQTDKEKEPSGKGLASALKRILD